jgi:hypothetical protein
MAQLYTYFSPHELSCHCGDCDLGEEDMSPEFMHRLIPLRRECDFSFPLSSSVRCPAHNAAVSSTGLTGPHTLIAVDDGPAQAHAVDVLLYGQRAFKVLGLAAQYGMTGLGVHQRGPRDKRFIHLDDLPNDPHPPRPWPWTY